MGTGEAHVEEERFRSVPLRDVMDRPAHGPRGRMEVFFRVPGASDPRIPVDPVIVRGDVPLFLPVEPLAVFVPQALGEHPAGFIQLRRLKTHVRPLRREVALAHQVGRIPGICQRAGQGMREVVGYGSLSPPHAEHARVPLVHAGHHGRPGGYAGRHRGVGVGEPRAPGGQVIQVRGFHHGMPVATQTVAAHLVRHDEYDIGTGHVKFAPGSTKRYNGDFGAGLHNLYAIRLLSRIAVSARVAGAPAVKPLNRLTLGLSLSHFTDDLKTEALTGWPCTRRHTPYGCA